MAGRTSARNQYYPRGVSRIFQQSVKELGHKEIHSTAESINVKPENLPDLNKHACESQLESNKEIENNKENIGVKTLTKKAVSDVDIDTTDNGKIPCLLSLDFKEKARSRVSGNTHRGSTFKTSVRGRGHRYSTERGWARRNRELNNKVLNGKAEATINHFNEDWLTDCEDPLASDVPDYGPLQSTPKKQSKDNKPMDTKPCVDSEPSKHLMVHLGRKSEDKNTNNCVQNVKSEDLEMRELKNSENERIEQNCDDLKGDMIAYNRNKHSDEQSTSWLSDTDSAVICFCLAEPNNDIKEGETDIKQDLERQTSHMNETISASRSKDVYETCKVSDIPKMKVKVLETMSATIEKDSSSAMKNDETNRNLAQIPISVATPQTSELKTSPDSRRDFGSKRKFSDRLSKVSPHLRSDVPPRFQKKACNEMNRDFSHQNGNFHDKRRISTLSQKMGGGFRRSVLHFSPEFEGSDQQDSLPNNYHSLFRDKETGTKYFKDNQEGSKHDMEGEVDEWVVPSSEDWSMEIRDEGLEQAEIQGENTERLHGEKETSLKVVEQHQNTGTDQDDKVNTIADHNNNVEEDRSGTSVHVLSGQLEQEKANYANKYTELYDNIQNSNEMTNIPYLPPPPSEEVKAFEELVDAHDIQARSDKEHSTNDDVQQVCEEINFKLTIADNDSKDKPDKKGINDHIANKESVEVDGLGDGSSVSYVFGLPLDDIQDIKSTCSDYLVNQSEFDCPVVTKSQEGSLESIHGSGDVINIEKQSKIQTHNRENVQYYNDYDYSNWWNAQQNVSYWNWYYYMYMESYRHTMNWQRQQNNHLVIEEQAEWKQQSNIANNNHFEEHVENDDKYQVGKMQVIDDSLQLDFVAERTNDWVNSHMPDPDARVLQDNAKHTMNKTRKGHADTARTVNLEVDVTEDFKDNISAINDMNTGERDGECVGLTCNCSARDVLFVTWRSCRCSPPTIHGIHSMGDLQSDMGYHSYESVIDLEDSSALKKSSGQHDQSASPLNAKLKLRQMDGKWNQRRPYLYEQIVGNRNLSQSQYVYMLHTKTSQSQGAPPSAVQPADNESYSSAHRPVDEQDENGNKDQQGTKTNGSLKALVEDINQNYRKTGEDSSAFSPYSGQSGMRDHFLNQRYQQRSIERSEELSAPLVQSEAHLSHVNKTLSNAEKTNSQLGKSVSVMKDAIAAIKKYTDQLKGEMESSETIVDVNANLAVNSKESENEATCAKNVKTIDSSGTRNVRETSNEHGKENVMFKMRVKPFKIKKRESRTYESSCEPLSESSDEICKDSMLSQSPSTRLKLDTMIAPHALVTSYSHGAKEGIKHGVKSIKIGKTDDNYSEEQPKIVTKLSHTYRGRGTSPASLRPSSSSIVDNPGIGNFSETSSIISDHVFEPRPGYGASIRQPLQPYLNPWLNLPKQKGAISPFTAKSAIDLHKTPQKQIHISEGAEKLSRPSRRRKSLVQYTVSDNSSSEDEEIQPFDVDSLSSDFNPGSNENIYKSASKEQCRPKKLKHDTTSDDDSTSTPPVRKVVEKPYKEPVMFLKRPSRKLSHTQLKDLPSDDLPPVHFVKKSASETKPQTQYPKTMAEFIAMHNQKDSKINENNDNNMLMTVNPPCGAIEVPSVPPLPPLPPFPQSQFWSMYLPKYNSALSGRQDSTSITPDVKKLSTSSVTPEMKRATMRRSWGGAGCALASPSESDTESDKALNNDWRASFRRFHDFGVKYIDTHCHLDFLFKREGFYGNLKDYMAKNQDLFPDTFEGCVAVFCNPVTFNPRGGIWKEVAKEDNVWFAMGCHPKMATDFTEISEAGLRECLKHEKCVALGEIGLDYSGTFQQHEDVQKEVFRKQLTIALEMNKPLVIHCRDAEQDCLDILKEMVPKDYKIHCHCFTGYYYNAKLWMEAFPNLFIGVTPLVTYRTATPSHDLARKIPLNRLLLETDAPYFVPNGVPKDWLMFSSPGLAVTVAKEIAQYQELPVAAVLRYCRLNTKSMYGI